jgi:hypothetical protein
MAEDDLDAPLGLDDGAQRASSREIPWGGLAFAGIGIIVASLVTFLFVSDDGMGGEPFAEAPIEKILPVADADSRVVVPAALSNTIVDKSQTASIGNSGGGIAVENGVKVIRARSDQSASNVQIIEIPDANSVHLSPTPDRRLVEKGPYGPLPKIGAGGLKPLAVYARPVLSRKLPAGAPRIAILVGGMGLSQTATRTALEKLPGEVTLGFAPYGGDLEAQVSRARGQGHEVVLQVPMESFDETPPSDPHVLSTSLAVAQNRDNLYWLMSRFTGYAGTANFLGAKFTGKEAAFGPVLKEIGARGLYYLDDGTSPRSLASSLAATDGTPVLNADLVLDASGQPDAVGAALEKLVGIAQQKGRAIGVASGLPASIDAIGRFAHGLEGRGIALVPLSAMIIDSAPAVAGGP